MIFVDVLVPPIDRIFDFEVTDQIATGNFKAKVEELIEEKADVLFSVKKREFFFYRAGEFLKDNLSLGEQGVINGDRLILI